jgi:hypothetical protein
MMSYKPDCADCPDRTECLKADNCQMMQRVRHPQGSGDKPQRQDVEDIVGQMMIVYAIPFTDHNSRQAAVESWARQLEQAALTPPATNARSGWRLVPVTLTEDMRNSLMASARLYDSHPEYRKRHIDNLWSDVLNIAPSAASSTRRIEQSTLKAGAEVVQRAINADAKEWGGAAAVAEAVYRAMSADASRFLPSARNALGLATEQEPKYTTANGRIVNRASGETIPDDEPVFIFRARDVRAAPVLRFYMTQVAANVEHWAAVERRLKDFQAFAESHPERMKEPDTVASASTTKDTK